jgi:glycosyltransferase involved in cell wall biosynthesis
MRPIRVMQVIARMNVGGPALQVSTLLRDLDPHLFEQRLYAGHPEPGEGDFRHLRAADVPIHPVPTLGRSVRLTDDARALAALIAAMREFRPHLVHTHTAKAGTLGRVAAAACRVPVRVHTFHGHLLHGYFPPGRTRMIIHTERALARLSHALIAVGARVRDELLAARVGRPDQFEVIPPGASLAPLPTREEARRALGLSGTGPVVAFVGRVTAIKRPDRMLAVAREVRRAVPAARFVVCGEGDQLAATLARATADGLDVRFLPWQADVETVYAAADLVLLTSDNEGMPVGLIEAGLAGRPVVATDVGGVAEVVRHGETGLLSDGDVQRLSGCVERLLRDDALRQRMGRAALATTGERFGSARLVADTARLYRRLAVERGWWPPADPDGGGSAAELAGRRPGG